MSATFVTKLDVSVLQQRLETAPELFGLFNYRREKYAHKDMVDIWVRYNHPSKIGEHFNDEHTSVWYPVVEFLPEVPELCAELLSVVLGERLGGVLITKLAPGGRIEPHTDAGWHAGYYSKFFVPIKNHPGAKFCWEGLEIEPAPGEVYEFQNNVPHWVENNSDQDRIAMIVCIKPMCDSIRETLSHQ